MTDYFEVLERDGAARIGELRFPEPRHTPSLADGIISDAGSLWTSERDVPSGAPTEITLLPHRGFPHGTDDRVATAFEAEYPEIEAPAGAVVTPTTATDHGVDVYVLSTTAGIDGHASAFREAIIQTRRNIPDDTALYLSGIATAETAPILAYVGVDLVDTHRAVIDGTRGRYHTGGGVVALDSLTELPCSCPVCQRGIESFTRTDCVDHNVSLLRSTLAMVRNRIRDGRLRDFVEGQVRHTTWITAVLREFDQEWEYLEERTPIYRQSDLAATTEDALHRIEIKRFADRVTNRYCNRFSRPLVVVPCSATKPYSESKSHGRFHEGIRYRAHLVSLSSPIGVVPQELELTYPAQHYDTAVSGRWTPGEIEFVSEVFKRYLERNPYDRVIAHVPDGGYRTICERVAAALDLQMEFTVDSHPTDEVSIANLDDALSDELQYSKGERQRNTIRAIADYQYGAGAGDALFERLRTESRYPKLRAHDENGDQLAAMVPEYGTLSLTLAGAERWHGSEIPTKMVEIDDFVPHGSVLAPGIIAADSSIRIGDEVVVLGPRAFGVGRAAMHGVAMTESTRGVAVDVRHVRERQSK